MEIYSEKFYAKQELLADLFTFWFSVSLFVLYDFDISSVGLGFFLLLQKNYNFIFLCKYDSFGHVTY